MVLGGWTCGTVTGDLDWVFGDPGLKLASASSVTEGKPFPFSGIQFPHPLKQEGTTFGGLQGNL